VVGKRCPTFLGGPGIRPFQLREGRPFSLNSQFRVLETFLSFFPFFGQFLIFRGFLNYLPFQRFHFSLKEFSPINLFSHYLI